MTPYYIDAHLHLQDARFSAGLKSILERAGNADVALLLCNSTREHDWSRVLEICQNNRSVIPFLGIHPWYAEEAARGWQQRLRDVLQQYSPLAGIGESGLDGICTTDFSRQIKVFEAHLEIAYQLTMPLALHCVRCWGVLVDILESYEKQGCLPSTMIHSFSGSYETMKRLTTIGCFISFSTKVADPGQKRLIEVFKQTPVDCLLFETDAPDQFNPLLPGIQETISGYNEPVLIPLLYQWGAHQRNIEPYDLTAQIEYNAKIFTNKTPAG